MPADRAESKPGWLQRQLDLAATEVATWPEWKQQMVREWSAAQTNPMWTCRHRSICHESQTCAGKTCRKVGKND